MEELVDIINKLAENQEEIEKKTDNDIELPNPPEFIQSDMEMLED